MDTTNVATNVKYWKQMWDIWDVRIIVLSSLFLQIFLLFFGPLRKRTGGFVTVLLWTAYLLSPVISSYGFGLISACIASPSHHAFTHPDLLGLWSPFLLLYLSRPDTITAFSQEDNELWLRNSIHLVGYIYYTAQAMSTIPSKSNLCVPAMIVYLEGLIKYCSWVSSLITSSQVGTNVILGEILQLTKVEESNEISDSQVLKHAYEHFTLFKGLIVDFSFTFDKCGKSREIFIGMNPRDVFRVVERELNFFYEFLYTRVWFIEPWPENLLKVVQFVAFWVALLFFYKEDKRNFRAGDTVITYSLLCGSIFLDASAMIMVFNSDWFAATIRSCNRFLKQVEKCPTFLKSWWPKIAYRRWSNCLSQYNLMKYCLRPAEERSKDYVLIITIILKTIEGIRHVEKLEFNEGIRDFIVNELKEKSFIAANASTAREIQSAKGNLVLVNENCCCLLHWVNDFDFDQSLLTWHVATDFCFHTDGIDDADDFEVKAVRNLSKWLSDYMLYSLIWQPAMMSCVDARGEKRFKET